MIRLDPRRRDSTGMTLKRIDENIQMLRGAVGKLAFEELDHAHARLLSSTKSAAQRQASVPAVAGENELEVGCTTAL